MNKFNYDLSCFCVFKQQANVHDGCNNSLARLYHRAGFLFGFFRFIYKTEIYIKSTELISTQSKDSGMILLTYSFVKHQRNEIVCF